MVTHENATMVACHTDRHREHPDSAIPLTYAARVPRAATLAGRVLDVCSTMACPHNNYWSEKSPPRTRARAREVESELRWIGKPTARAGCCIASTKWASSGHRRAATYYIERCQRTDPGRPAGRVWYGIRRNDTPVASTLSLSAAKWTAETDNKARSDRAARVAQLGGGTVSKLTVHVREFHPVKRNTLTGFATLWIAEMKLTIREVAIHAHTNGSRWARLAEPADGERRRGAQAIRRQGRLRHVSALMSAYGGKADVVGSLRAFPLDPSQTFGESAFVDLVAAERLGVAFKAEARTEGVAMARP